MSTYYQQFLGRFSINTSNNNLTVAGTALTLTSGNYYLAGYTGESTDQLCEHLQAQIRTVAGHSGATVVYSGTTGQVTITLGATATISFTDAYLAYILGFSSATQSGADTYVSDQNPRYVWRPTIGASGHPVNLINLWAPRSTTRVYRSPNGTTYSIEGDELNDALIEYSLLPDDDVVTPATGTVYRDLQQFFRDVVHAGQPMRVYPDRTVNTSADYKTAIFGRDDQEIVGSFQDYIARWGSDYSGLWDISIPLMEYLQ